MLTSKLQVIGGQVKNGATQATGVISEKATFAGGILSEKAYTAGGILSERGAILKEKLIEKKVGQKLLSMFKKQPA